jgi:hypothetical protein
MKIKINNTLVAVFIGAAFAGGLFAGGKNISQAQPVFGQEKYLAERESDDNFEVPQNPEVVPIVPQDPPAGPVAVQPEVPAPAISSVPWYVARAAGIAAYLLMFCIIVLGEGMTTGTAYAFLTPVNAWVIHKYLGIAFGLTLLLHMFSLLFDKFVYFSLQDILVPFSSNYNRVFLSLGIFGFYLAAAIIASSLLVRLKFPAFWRYIHFLVYPLFILSIIHGVFLGTDTKTLAMQLVYALTGAIFILLLVHRWRLHLSRA